MFANRTDSDVSLGLFMLPQPVAMHTGNVKKMYIFMLCINIYIWYCLLQYVRMLIGSEKYE